MGDSLTIIVTIMLAAILMFVFPMMAMAERNDDVAQLTVQTAIAEFVNNARNTGKITEADYDKLITSLNATGNTFDVALELQVLDANPSRKKEVLSNLSADQRKIGENVYYSIYTSQIMGELERNRCKVYERGRYIKSFSI